MQVKGSGIGDSTRITYDKVEEDVDSINESSQEMDNLFNNFRNSMNSIAQDEVFEGTASESYQEKFDELKAGFDDYVAEVKKFAEVIEKAKTSTENTERKAKQNAENLPH